MGLSGSPITISSPMRRVNASMVDPPGSGTTLTLRILTADLSVGRWSCFLPIDIHVVRLAPTSRSTQAYGHPSKGIPRWFKWIRLCPAVPCRA